MHSMSLINHKGTFRGSFPNTRDAKNFVYHAHINNYFLEKAKGHHYENRLLY